MVQMVSQNCPDSASNLPSVKLCTSQLKGSTVEISKSRKYAAMRSLGVCRPLNRYPIGRCFASTTREPRSILTTFLRQSIAVLMGGNARYLHSGNIPANRWRFY